MNDERFTCDAREIKAYHEIVFWVYHGLPLYCLIDKLKYLCTRIYIKRVRDKTIYNLECIEWLLCISLKVGPNYH